MEDGLFLQKLRVVVEEEEGLFFSALLPSGSGERGERKSSLCYYCTL